MLHSSSFSSLPLPSFHHSLPHIHDPIINLVEISRLLITHAPLFLLPSLWLSIASDSGYFSFFFCFPLSVLSVAIFSVLLADENEVMLRVRGVKAEDWVTPPSLVPSGTFSDRDSES